MFNHLDHNARQAALRDHLAAAPDKSWQKDLAARWGDFQGMLADRTAKNLEEFAGRHPAPDTLQAKYIAETKLKIETMHEEARAFRDGTMPIEDPADAEAILRLFQEASTPRPAPTDDVSK